jgi:hypothetical protein
VLISGLHSSREDGSPGFWRVLNSECRKGICRHFPSSYRLHWSKAGFVGWEGGLPSQVPYPQPGVVSQG